MLTELLRPAGPELARRWLAALLLAPEQDREAIVERIEARMAAMYADDSDEAPEQGEVLLHIAEQPVRKNDRIEQYIRSYARAEGAGPERGAGAEEAVAPGKVADRAGRHAG